MMFQLNAYMLNVRSFVFLSKTMSALASGMPSERKIKGQRGKQ